MTNTKLRNKELGVAQFVNLQVNFLVDTLLGCIRGVLGFVPYASLHNLSSSGVYTTEIVTEWWKLWSCSLLNALFGPRLIIRGNLAAETIGELLSRSFSVLSDSGGPSPRMETFS